jgi:hypothetical protein
MFAYGAEGDYRDAEHVAEWVERIAGDLKIDRASMVRVIDSTPAADPTPPPPLPVVPPPPTPEPVDEPPTLDEAEPERQEIERAPKRGRLRRYLRLDDDGDDEGLDLFDEDELEAVGDPHDV